MRRVSHRPDYAPLTSREILRRAEKKRTYVRMFVFSLLTAICLFMAYTLYHFTHRGDLTRQWEQAFNTFKKLTLDLGIVLKHVNIEGQTETPEDQILSILGLEKGSALISLNPAEVKEKLEELPWVYEARVERRFPDAININIVEKLPMALWQQEGVIYLIDHEGKVIEGAEIKKYNQLPLLVGEGATQAAPAFFDFIYSEESLKNLVTSAVRIGNRRWDVHLKNNIVVKLPEKNPEIAWTQLALINQEHQLLGRDVAMLDFRLSDRIIVKMHNEDQKVDDIQKSDVTNPSTKINT